MCHATPDKFRVMGRRLNNSQGFRPRNKDGVLVTVKQCTQCKVIFSDPMPLPDNFDDHYGVPPEEYWKGESTDWWQPSVGFAQYRVRPVKDLIQLKLKSKILDIGAGAGQVMKAFMEEGYDVYGLEPSFPFYKHILDNQGVSADKLSNVSI